MRARLVDEGGGFVAEVEAPDGTAHIRFGERHFMSYSGDPDTFAPVEVFTAPTEGALVVEP